jgi:hypothetical protein
MTQFCVILTRLLPYNRLEIHPLDYIRRVRYLGGHLNNPTPKRRAPYLIPQKGRRTRYSGGSNLYKSCVPVVWTSLGPLPRWVPRPTTRWAPGTTRLGSHGTWWRGTQGLRWRSTQIGSCACPVPCSELRGTYHGSTRTWCTYHGSCACHTTSTLSPNRLVILPPGLYKARQGPLPLSYSSSCKHTRSI